MASSENEIITTDVWRDYEKGVNYNRIKQLYTKTQQNYNFYHSKQWEGVQLGDIEPITLNIIKPIIKYKLGVVNANSYSIVYTPNNFESKEFQKEMLELCKHFNKHTAKVWELEQMERKVREAVKDSCINSEGILYFYIEENEEGMDDIKCELIDKTNIYYGNENDADIQAQPYIIISFRRTVQQVRDEARKNGLSDEEIANIVSDNEVMEQSGYNAKYQEISPMCLVLLKLYKVNGIVHSIKSTKTVVIQPEQSNGMTLYPVAHIIWEDEKGNARGIGEVEGLISNQIEINRTATRRAIAVKIGAYPKLVANIDDIDNPSALDQVGVTIKMSGQTVDDVNKKIGYLRPATMSIDSKTFQEEMITNTRELNNAGDIATGNVNPEQASGRAILAVQQASQQPLNEQTQKVITFREDIGRIFFDMWKAYEVDGMTILKTEEQEDGTELEVPVVVPRSVLEKLKASVNVEVTPKSPYDKYAQELSLENLLVKGMITFEEYVDALDEDSNMPKAKLVNILKKREEARAEIEAMQEAVHQNQMLMNRKLQIQAIQDQVDANHPNIEAMVGGNNEMQVM